MEEGVEFHKASEENIVFSRNVFGERRGVSEFSERIEFWVYVAVLVLLEVVDAEESETVNGQVESTATVKDIK